MWPGILIRYLYLVRSELKKQKLSQGISKFQHYFKLQARGGEEQEFTCSGEMSLCLKTESPAPVSAFIGPGSLRGASGSVASGGRSDLPGQELKSDLRG